MWMIIMLQQELTKTQYCHEKALVPTSLYAEGQEIFSLPKSRAGLFLQCNFFQALENYTPRIFFYNWEYNSNQLNNNKKKILNVIKVSGLINKRK